MDWFAGSKKSEAKKLISQLADSSKRDRAARDLIQLGADAVPPLMDALQTQDLNLLPIYQHILARIPSASPALTTALQTAHLLMRGRVAETFAINKDKNAVPVLLEALQGEFFTVRARAALALGAIGNAGVIPALFPLLKDMEEEVRIAACMAIGKFRDPSTFDEITEVLLTDPKIEVRKAAARALGETRHPAAIPFLLEALRDSFWWYENDQEVLVLLDAIEKMGQPVVGELIRALGDSERNVRRFAAVILGNLRDMSAIEELGMAVYDLHHEVGQAAAEALAKFGGPTVGLLSEALTHPEAAIREHAVLGLGSIQDARVAPLLIEMLGDSERIVRKQVVRALGQLRDERAISALKEIAADRSDREMSMLAKEIIAERKG